MSFFQFDCLLCFDLLPAVYSASIRRCRAYARASRTCKKLPAEPTARPLVLTSPIQAVGAGVRCVLVVSDAPGVVKMRDAGRGVGRLGSPYDDGAAEYRKATPYDSKVLLGQFFSGH